MLSYQRKITRILSFVALQYSITNCIPVAHVQILYRYKSSAKLGKRRYPGSTNATPVAGLLDLNEKNLRQPIIRLTEVFIKV